MRKFILFLTLIVFLACPLFSSARDILDDALNDNIRTSEQNERNYNRHRRDMINDNMRRALDDGDMDEARRQQQQMDRQLIQERIRDPFSER